MLDFMAYWQHRLLHTVPFLWNIHKFHHSAESFATITVLREHPLDGAVRSIFLAFPIALLGYPVIDYPILVTLIGMVGYFKHSQLLSRWGWFGTYVIQSPLDHWIHHSDNPKHFNSNYSNNFAIWDHLFGTYYKGTDVNTSIGLTNEKRINEVNTFKALWLCEKDLLIDMTNAVLQLSCCKKMKVLLRL